MPREGDGEGTERGERDQRGERLMGGSGMGEGEGEQCRRWKWKRGREQGDHHMRGREGVGIKLVSGGRERSGAGARASQTYWNTEMNSRDKRVIRRHCFKH